MNSSEFYFEKVGSNSNTGSRPNTAYLKIDHWNDFSFVTMFDLIVYDENGKRYEIGKVKIGFIGQTSEECTYTKLGKTFQKLDDKFFSLGMDVDFYKKIYELDPNLKENILSGLNDLVKNQDIIPKIEKERVLNTSLLRSVSMTAIEEKFSRALNGLAPLTNFLFRFERESEQKFAGYALDFHVIKNSKPSTNIHAIIGRNGVGKTSLLNEMVLSIISNGDSGGKFYNTKDIRNRMISETYFSSLVSVSFSAFDPFKPPKEQTDPSQGTCYYYIGLKDVEGKLRDLNKLYSDVSKALVECFHNSTKQERWLKSINTLSSDNNFAEMQLTSLMDTYNEIIEQNREIATDILIREYEEKIHRLLSRMSSGHFIVFFTISRLVATVEEKTLVLIDEPESHLHPPLLSAYIRALSDLLYDMNGVAIIATHSPVVLQEIPKSCVNKMYRSGLELKITKPEAETFGENVGILTKDVFKLEVTKSGFHELLNRSVERGDLYDEILFDYDEQLGFEARAILMALIKNRNRLKGN